MDEERSAPTTVLTLGHSNRTLGELIAVLAAHGVRLLVDVRRAPGSRRHPHFARAALAEALAAAGIAYGHEVDLGGRRQARPDSPFTALDPELRGYADHMLTPAFARALARLLAEARGRRTAVMCAEADWRHCHRALLSDRLRADGVEVLHVADASPPVRHPWSEQARVVDGRPTWRAPVQGTLPGLG